MLPLRAAIAQGLIALTLVILSLVIATQWAAAMLGHQPALGAAWCELFGLPWLRSGELPAAPSLLGEPPGGPAVKQQ